MNTSATSSSYACKAEYAKAPDPRHRERVQQRSRRLPARSKQRVGSAQGKTSSPTKVDLDDWQSRDTERDPRRTNRRAAAQACRRQRRT